MGEKIKKKPKRKTLHWYLYASHFQSFKKIHSHAILAKIARLSNPVITLFPFFFYVWKNAFKFLGLEISRPWFPLATIETKKKMEILNQWGKE
jgi:hypothetical protein